MKFKWEHQTENEVQYECFHCEYGVVIKRAEGWEAWAMKPREMMIGECYRTSASAQSAVARFIHKYAPLAA